MDPEVPANRTHANRIVDYKPNFGPSYVLPEEIGVAIMKLWQDPVIPQIMDHSSEFYLMDSAS